MHPCLKRVVTCELHVLNKVVSTGANRCLSSKQDVCAREVAGAKAGEQYDLCGPPIHAEAQAVSNLLKAYPEWDPHVYLPQDLEAHIYNQSWICSPCENVLAGVGFDRIVLHGKGNTLERL